MNPLENQQSPPQPSGPQQGNPNPLAQLAGPLPGLPPRPPAPSTAQATAAVRRFGAVADAIRAVLSNPDLGRKNVRPAILDQASKLLSARVISLSECMNSIGQISDDPQSQKQQVEEIFNSARQAESSVIDHHGAAVAAGRVQHGGGEKYDPAHHDRHISNLLKQYPKV